MQAASSSCAVRSVRHAASAGARVAAPRMTGPARRHACTASATAAVIPDVYMENHDAEISAFQAHQKTAARPSAAEDARTWMALSRHGVLATVPADPEPFPLTSAVEFVADSQGRPVFAVSTRSPHTAHLADTGRISLTVTAPAFSSLADGRVSLQGAVRAVSDQERPALRELFLAKYPGSFWVDFGDFRWFILEDLCSVRVNGGFAMAGQITPEDFIAAAPDPVAQFSGPVCSHMNDDHQADMAAMVAHYTGLQSVEHVKLLDLDRLGLNAEVKRKGQSFKMRLPFSTPAPDRKGIKEAIVEMTKAARQAAAKAKAATDAAAAAPAAPAAESSAA